MISIVFGVYLKRIKKIIKRIYSIGYEYIFFFFYKNWPTDIPQMNASIFYSLILILWVAVLIVALNIFKLIDNVFDIRIVGLVCYIFLFLLNSFLFVWRKEYKNVADRFNSLDASQKRVKYRVGLLVASLGFLIPFILFYLKVFYWS